MKAHTEKQQKIEAALKSLDGVERAKAAPYLFTRIYARLNKDEESIWEKILQLISKPSVAFLGLCVILALNGSILAWVSGEEESQTAEHQIQQEFAEDYNLAVNTYYDYEIK
ncbi:MAG TPA: hypothetical protein VIK74_07185 [Parasegetibacter sp.]